MRMTPRIILPAIAALLLLPACSASQADAFSFTNAIAAAKGVDQYRFETTAEVDGEELSMVCDVDLGAEAMRCDMGVDGETLTFVADIGNTKVYLDVEAALADAGEVGLNLPDGVKWLEFPLDAAGEMGIDDSMFRNPLETVDVLDGVAVVEDGELVRNGETLRGYKVSLPRELAYAFMASSDLPADELLESMPETIVYRFFVDKASNLRGFTYDLEDASGETATSTIELWIDAAKFAEIELPTPDSTRSYEELFGSMMDSMEDPVKMTLEAEVEQTAWSVARDARALGVFTESTLPGAEEIVTALDEAALNPEDGWTVSSPDEVRATACAVVTRTAGGRTATAYIRVSEAGEVSTGAGPCTN